MNEDDTTYSPVDYKIVKIISPLVEYFDIEKAQSDIDDQRAVIEKVRADTDADIAIHEANITVLQAKIDTVLSKVTLPPAPEE